MRVTSAFALAAAIVVSAFPAPPAGFAQTCQRTVSIAPQVSAGEGAGKATFAVRSGGCAAGGEVGYEAIAGTAMAGADFRLPAGRLRWAADETAVMTITAVILADTAPEDDLENFTIRLIDPSPGVLIAHPTGQGRILDDDGPIPLWSLDDELCPDLLPNQWCSCEAEIMPWKPLCIGNELHLSAPQPSPATFRWSTIDGTARAGVDYVAVEAQTQTVAAGATAAALPVQLLPRPPGTPRRWFYVRISAVSAGAIVDAVAMFTLDGA